MTTYAADAHSIVWYLEDNPKLSSTAAAAFDQDDAIFAISVITVAELMLIVNKSRSTITPAELHEFLSREESLRIMPLTFDHVMAAMRLDDLSGLHDRFIVAAAKSLVGSEGFAGLLTADAEITASKLVPVVW